MTTATTQHFVEYLYPGLIVGETSIKRIDDVDSLHMKMPDGAVAWRTHERSATFVGGEELLGKIKNRSGWTYYGRRLTLADAQRELPSEHILLSNMKLGDYDVVQVRGRHFQLHEADRVLRA